MYDSKPFEEKSHLVGQCLAFCLFLFVSYGLSPYCEKAQSLIYTHVLVLILRLCLLNLVEYDTKEGPIWLMGLLLGISVSCLETVATRSSSSRRRVAFNSALDPQVLLATVYGLGIVCSTLGFDSKMEWVFYYIFGNLTIMGIHIYSFEGLSWLRSGR